MNGTNRSRKAGLLRLERSTKAVNATAVNPAARNWRRTQGIYRGIKGDSPKPPPLREAEDPPFHFSANSCVVCAALSAFNISDVANNLLRLVNVSISHRKDKPVALFLVCQFLLLGVALG